MNLKPNYKTPRQSAVDSLRQRMLEIAELESGTYTVGQNVDKNERICRALVENSLGLMCIHDLEGNLLYVNPAAAQSLGFRAEDGVGRNLRLFLAPSVEHAFDGYLERIRKQGSDTGFMRLLSKDGSERVWLYRNLIYQEPAMPPCVLGHAQDVTAWIRVEQVLKESEQRFRIVADHAPVMIWMTDAEGRVVFLNKQWREFTAMPNEGATAVAWNEYIYPEDSSLAESQSTAIRERRPFQVEYRFRRADGEYRWVLNHGIPRFTPSGSFEGFIGSCIDITDSQRMREELERAHDELAYRVLARTAELQAANEQLQREICRRNQMEDELLKARNIESIGLLAGGIAHDFNNILTVMLGNLALAKMHFSPDDPILDSLGQIEKAGQRASALTAQLLTFAKGGAPVRRPVSAEQVIVDSVDFAMHGSNVKVDMLLDADLWTIDVDPNQISGVLHNVIINAQQAMPNGGVVEVRAGNFNAHGEPVPLQPGKYVRIAIRDQGPGISSADLTKIFDPYFTTKQSGSGLGLASAYAVLTKHHGLISADSEIGAGTTFYIYVPATEERPLEKSEKAGRRILSSGTARVLVMDDENAIRELTGEMLSRLGFQVESAAEGSQALRLYERAMDRGRPFDIVLLDLTVPGGMGGLETLEKLRAINPEVKAIVSSGYSEDPVMSDFKKFGFCGVIRKPWSPDELQRVFHTVLYGGSE